MTKGMKILIVITGVLAAACIALGITLFVSARNHKETTPVVAEQFQMSESTTTSTTDTTTSTTAKKTTTSTTATTETTTTVATTTENIYIEASNALIYTEENKPYIHGGTVDIQDPNGTLNVRKYPDPNSEIIGHLKYHQEVEYLDKPINGFYMISIDQAYDNCGYVSVDYLKKGYLGEAFPEELEAIDNARRDAYYEANKTVYDNPLNDIVRFHADNPILVYNNNRVGDKVMYEISDIHYRIEKGKYEGQYRAFMTSYTITNVGDIEVEGYPGSNLLYVFDAYGNLVDDVGLDIDITSGLPYGESRTDTSEHETGNGWLVEGDYYIRPNPWF